LFFEQSSQAIRTMPALFQACTRPSDRQSAKEKSPLTDNPIVLSKNDTDTLSGGNMRLYLQKVRNIVLFLIVGAVLAPTLTVRGEDHLVSPSDLHDTLAKSAETRQKNLEKVQRFFSSERVRKTLASTKIDLKKVEDTVHQLNDKELARLAAQAEKVQADVAAGALDNQQITYIIIALATAVLILVIVVA
jgi:hypothetical protein